MDLGPVAFFAFLAAVILAPQVLAYNDRRRLHDTLRAAFERGQTVPPELIMALQPRGRRYRYDPYAHAAAYPGAMGWRQPAAAPPAAGAPAGEAGPPFDATAPAAEAFPPGAMTAPFLMEPPRRDLRRGLIWLGVGLGFFGAGAACYAGLYNVGGSQETFSMFAAFGSIPLFVGLTYLALWGLESRKTRA